VKKKSSKEGKSKEIDATRERRGKGAERLKRGISKGGDIGKKTGNRGAQYFTERIPGQELFREKEEIKKCRKNIGQNEKVW